MLGSQLWQLFNATPLLLCDLQLDDDDCYNSFLVLQEITAIAFSPFICLEQIQYLELLIQQYLEKFKAILHPKLLTPKCHFLIHLPTLLRRYNVYLCVYVCMH